jgi:hypothetical protein
LTPPAADGNVARMQTEAPPKGRRGVRDSKKSWFRGEFCNFHPFTADLRAPDSVLKQVLAGWLPEEPLIDRDTRIVAFGSCFAANITQYLAGRRFNVLTAKGGEHADTYLVRFSEGMVNSFAIRQQFEWALEQKVPEAALWHDDDAQAYSYKEDIRVETSEVFGRADVFIITLGLAEVWYDEPTGGVFWRAVPQEIYDPARHRFRVSSVEENKENIKATYRLIKKHRPEAKVILTLSPIPLKATFRPVSCITANWVSKSIMRVAIDEAYRELNDPKGLYYWPSYEIVMDIFPDRWTPERRHIKQPILDFIMTLFETVWCRNSTPARTLLETWVEARSDSGSLPKRLPRLLKDGKVAELDALVEKLRKGNRIDADLVTALREEIALKSSPPRG